MHSKEVRPTLTLSHLHRTLFRPRDIHPRIHTSTEDTFANPPAVQVFYFTHIRCSTLSNAYYCTRGSDR